MERSKQIWRWLQINIGIANVILLLAIVPVTGWIVVHDYLLERGQKIQQEEFMASQDQFKRVTAITDQSRQDTEATLKNLDLIAASMKQMSDNMRTMAEQIKTERSRPFIVQMPMRSNRAVDIASPCPRFAIRTKVEKFGDSLVYTRTFVLNPDYKDCFEKFRNQKKNP